MLNVTEQKIAPKRLAEEQLILWFLGQNNKMFSKNKEFAIKNDFLALKFMNMCHTTLENKNDKEVGHEILWTMSNTCVRFAQGNNLARAYAIRAKVLNHFNKYEASIEDSERGWKLMCDYDKEHDSGTAEFLLENILHCHVKLKRHMTMARRNEIFKCYAELFKKRTPMSSVLASLREIGLYKANENKKIKHQKDLAVIDRHDHIPWASRSLNFEQNEMDGEFRVIAARDIEPGEILAVNEKTFFYTEMEVVFHNCFYCRKFSWNPLPCDTCSLMEYCSENCKTEHWRYHYWECTVIPYQSLVRRRGAFYLFLKLTRDAGGYDKFVDYVQEGKFLLLE